MRRWWWGLVALGLVAQAPPEAVIRVDVNLIQIDVTAVDRAGRRVEDLTAADFEVKRDGKRQRLKSVEWVAGRRGTEPVAGTGAAGSVLRPQDVRRTVALFLDDLSLSGESLETARRAMRDFVEKNYQPGDLVALFRSSSGIGVRQQLTGNKEQLLRQIETLSLRRNVAVDALAAITTNPAERDPDPLIAEQALLQRLREEEVRRDQQDILTSVMLAAAGVVVDGLREVPGRKSLVLFSENVQTYDAALAIRNPNLPPGMITPNAMGAARMRTAASMRRLVDRANRGGVVIYTIDPRGLVYTGLTAADMPSGDARMGRAQLQQRTVDFNLSQDGMVQLAEETGGLAFTNTNDISGALSTALADQEGYYLIAFEPDEETFASARSQSKFHNLKVECKRAGVRLRYRRGFYGYSDEAERRQTDPLISALVSPFAAQDVPLQLTPLFLRDGAGKPMLRGLVYIDLAGVTPQAGENGQMVAELDQVLLLLNGDGERVFSTGRTHTVKGTAEEVEKVRQAGLVQEFEMPLPRHGVYQLRTAVREKASGLMGTATQFVWAPDLTAKALALSDIGLNSRAYAREGKLAGGPAVRLMQAGDTLEYGCLIYNSRVSKEGARTRLETQTVLLRDGKVVFRGKKNVLEAAGHQVENPVSFSGSLTLGNAFEPGQYVLQLAVRDLLAPKGREFAVRAIEFRIR